MKIAIYPGSFDPVTKGHLDILHTAAEIFDKVIIAVARNPQKQGFLPVDVRVKLIKERGLRAVSDFEYEMQLSQANSALACEVKTVFLTTKPKYNFISSSTIKEIYLNKGDISKFVPEPVNEYLQNTSKC